MPRAINISREEAFALIDAEVVQKLNSKVMILGIRGFSGANKRGIYDDAIVLITPAKVMAVTANTDPSIDRKGIAVLQNGDYWYKRGLHGVHHLNMAISADKTLMEKLLRTNIDLDPIPGRTLPYFALRQDSPVTVLRDGQKAPETVTDPSRWPWIDIHRGGYNTTSSEGCQTIHPDQWVSFRDEVFKAMIDFAQPRVPYSLRTKTA